MGQTQLAGLLLTSACVRFDSEPINQLKWPSPESTWEGIAQLCGDEGVRSTGGNHSHKNLSGMFNSSIVSFPKGKIYREGFKGKPITTKNNCQSFVDTEQKHNFFIDLLVLKEHCLCVEVLPQL